MVRSGKPLFIVESVEKVVKFYTEKLGFDLVNAATNTEVQNKLAYAEVRKGKCYIMFRIPYIGELAELSMVKGCSGRGSGVYVELKKGLDKFFERCEKKGVSVVQQPKRQPWGFVEFMIKDPFGLRITFSQVFEEGVPSEMVRNFCGLEIDERDLAGGIGKDVPVVDKMIKWLKGFGILRRVAKKFVRIWHKRYQAYTTKK